MAIYLGDLELATGAAAATGTGLPVNSYAPFYKSVSGNPTGYNATTGLYNHPNGDVWLETGKTIVDTSNAYPDATGVDVVTNDFVTVNTTPTSAAGTADFQFFQGDSFYMVATRQYPSNRYYKYDNSDNYLGTFTLSNPYVVQAIDVGNNNLIVRNVTAPYAMYRYTNNGVYISTETTPGNYYNISPDKNTSTTYVSSNIFVGAVSGTPGSSTTIGRWDVSTDTTTAPFAPQTGMGCFYDATKDYYYATDIPYAVFYLYKGPMSSLTAPTSALVNSGLALGFHNGYFYNMVKTGGNNTPVVISKNSGLGFQVGNATLQYGGSSASNIPMFVKLK